VIRQAKLRLAPTRVEVPLEEAKFMYAIARTVRRSVWAALLALVMAQSSAFDVAAHEFSSKTITVSHPWARATPPGAEVGAAYFEIKSSAEGGDRLIGASAEGLASRVEIHTHEHQGDIMKMRQIDGLDVAAASTVVLKPAGYHLMLMGLKKPLKEGDLVAIALDFEKAGRIPLEVTVEPVGASGPHGMEHQPGHGPDEHGGHDHGQHDQHKH
jgi:hypothetical protein